MVIRHPVRWFVAVAALAARVANGAWPDLSGFGASTEYPALPLLGYWAVNLIC